jgi:colanic acid/amylovoran biosynthesis glycosyltransferase
MKQDSLRRADAKRNVIIYREELLAPSETFILAQGERLSRFRPFYVGLRDVAGLSVPADRRLLLCRQDRFGCICRERIRLIGPSAAHLRRLRNLEPMLIHAHFGMDAANAIVIARQLQIPLLVTFHGWDATVRDRVFRWKSTALRRYVRRRPELALTAARVVCVSDFIRRQVIAKGFPAATTVVHYTGIDIGKFTPNPTVHRKPLVLFVGRLTPKKGCEYLIRAIRMIQHEIPDVELVVIGDGPLRESLEQLAHSTLRTCRFLGVQPQAVIRDWMNRAAVFSVPSIVADSGDAEGFGMVFAESQAMGLPVAGFASGGVPEAVSHGKTGLLASERDSKALAQNIFALLTDGSMWQSFSDAGRTRVRELFDLDKQTAKLEGMYQQVLEQHRMAIRS